MRCQLVLSENNASKGTLAQQSACPVEFAQSYGVLSCGLKPIVNQLYKILLFLKKRICPLAVKEQSFGFAIRLLLQQLLWLFRPDCTSLLTLFVCSLF